jgi:DNA-binding PadR family transcriptional regulator
MVQQLLLLGMLLNGKMHGYRLNEHFTYFLSGYADIKKSTVYYTLRKLEKDGYVEQETEREGNRPERRVYQITEKGRGRFLDLLREHLKDYKRTYYADDAVIAFMDRLPAAEVRLLLFEKRENIQAVLKQVQEHPGHGDQWYYVISHNIAHLEADLAWIDGILKEMGNV